MSCCTLSELQEKIAFIPDITGDYNNDDNLLDDDSTNTVTQTIPTFERM